MKKKWLWLIAVTVLVCILLALLLLPKGTPAPPVGETEETTLPADTEEPVPSDTTGSTGAPEGTETKPEKETGKEEHTTPSLPQELPPVVELPVVTDPATGTPAGITFPATVEGYDLVIEKLADYDGMFVEDGSNVQVQGVAMLLLKNNGDFPIEYTEITAEYENTTLTFCVTALPVGASLVVQEKNGQSVPEGKLLACRAMVLQKAELSMSEEQVKVTDNGDGSITVTNLTKENIPTVRVFYKYYMQQQDIYVGGIAFTVRISRLDAGSSVTVRPAHYSAGTCKVVMVMTYSEEV